MSQSGATGGPGDGQSTLVPSRCAVVVVDMQNDYCHERGALSRMGHDLSEVQRSLPFIEELLELARDADIPRIYLRTTHSDWFTTPAWAARGRGAQLLMVDRDPVVQEGSWGAEFYQLRPRSDELVITKHRYSGFFHTPLELALRAKDRDTVVLTGTATNVCVHATAMDAVMRGFYPIVVAECVTSAVTELHEFGIRNLAGFVGSVVSVDDLRSAWSAAESEVQLSESRLGGMQ